MGTTPGFSAPITLTDAARTSGSGGEVGGGCSTIAHRSRSPTPQGRRGRVAKLKAFAGVGLTTAGLGLLIGGGLYSADGPLGLPVIALGILFAGLVGLGVVGTRLFGEWADSDPERPKDGTV